MQYLVENGISSCKNEMHCVNWIQVNSKLLTS